MCLNHLATEGTARAEGLPTKTSKADASLLPGVQPVKTRAWVRENNGGASIDIIVDVVIEGLPVGIADRVKSSLHERPTEAQASQDAAPPVSRHFLTPAPPCPLVSERRGTRNRRRDRGIRLGKREGTVKVVATGEEPPRGFHGCSGHSCPIVNLSVSCGKTRPTVRLCQKQGRVPMRT